MRGPGYGKTGTVNVPHTLGQKEAHRQIADGFDSVQRGMSPGLAGAIAFQQRWEGERLHFDESGLGQRISGSLDVLDNSVQIQVDLPEFLAAIADRIKAALTTGTAKLLQNAK